LHNSENIQDIKQAGLILLGMQYGIKSRPYLVFLHFGAEKG